VDPAPTQPSRRADPTDPRADQPREVAGYRILRRIAEGGMGIVYEAEQANPRRHIALKVLKSALGSTDARQRFEYESGVLGRLRHPCVGQVYEAGSFLAGSGERVPFYAMELIQDGKPITTYADEHGLDERARLELFARALDGVHHGHQRGVVHRDLKPANILVDHQGLPKIIDFGVARELARDESTTSVETRTGQVLGTPQYMSPEQCDSRSHDIDLRTDVYSLGVVMFELLGGTLPYDFSGIPPLEFARVIREARPLRLSSTGRVRRGDLDTIVGKALDKDPERRYASVAALADDIRHYLRREPIAARPPSALYQLRMFARRNTAVVVGLTAVLAAIVTAAVVAVLLAFRLGDVADRERTLREQALAGAARLAARTVGIEIELRWRILESVAARDELRVLLSAAAVDGEAAVSAREALSAWLDDQVGSQSQATEAVSWFVVDQHGVQQARVPPSAETVGKNFAFRDYFHGLGRELPPDATADVRPIRDAHRSMPFRSQATRNLMVAFSVPIPAEGDRDLGGEADPIGVLGMTVEVGRFGVLQLGLGSQQIAVLIDSRADESGRCGLVLHHAELANLQLAPEAGSDELPTYYASSAQVALFAELRRARVERAGRMAARSWEERLVVSQGVGVAALDAQWRDPVGGDYAGGWLAAFEPVLIEGRAGGIRDTGWVVVVQERLVPAGG
jgi:hypothetical protein